MAGTKTTGTGESPWLFAPTISADPKLSNSVGAVAGYLHRFDQGSQPSMIAAFGTYSDTDSYFWGAAIDAYFRNDDRRVVAGGVSGYVRNDYDDFLGTGKPAKTEDDIDALFFRYLQRLSGQWYLGAQAVSSNYAINAEGFLGEVLQQIGLTGFDSTGLGLVTEFDTRDNLRNPAAGRRFSLHNLAYRKSLGGDESFDVLLADYNHYLAFGESSVLALQARGRWTKDAPLAGYSSVSLRGYTRGNYLEKNYTHFDADARFWLSSRWGLSLFAGVACLYQTPSDCGKTENLYPAIGSGLLFLVKPEAGIVVRAELAVGESDNSAFYLRMGHPF